MSERSVYGIYDFDRDRFPVEFEALSRGKALEEFSTFYNSMVPDWEHRTLGRYFLVRLAVMRAGVFERVEDVVATDEEVRLSYIAFREADPPHDAASEAALDREYRRLTSLDAARLARRANQALVA